MDAKEVIEQKINSKDFPPTPPVVKKGTMLIHMKGSTGSWKTASGVKFTVKQPFQVVPEFEASHLLEMKRFEQANPEDVKEHFGI